jgi:superfamily II DNA/RNA helicase
VTANRNTILRSKVHTYGQLRNIERQVFKNKINPKFEAFYEIYRRRPGRTIVYFEEKKSVSDFVEFIRESMPPSVRVSTITSETTPAQKTRNMNNRNINIYAMTSAGKVGLDFKGIINVVFMEYPWTASNYAQIVGRAVRTGSHDLFNRKDVKVYNLMYRAPAGHAARFKNELQLNRIQQKKNIGNLVKANLSQVSIETAGVTRPNTPSPARAATPRVAARLNKHTYAVSPRGNTLYSTAAPRSIVRAGVKYSPSNWSKLSGVPRQLLVPPPQPPKTKRPRTARVATARNVATRRRINAVTRAVGPS